MSDVLTITVPTPAHYPTVNTMWATSARRGKKIPSYHILFDAVYEAAKAEMARTGWQTADYYVETKGVLYVTSARAVPDPSNCMKCENDAMTAAKVWRDDALARPCSVDIEYDPDGVGRVVIMLRRRFPPYVAKASRIFAKVRERSAPVERAAVRVDGLVSMAGGKPKKVVWVNGVATDYDEAMRDLKLSMAKGGGKR